MFVCVLLPWCARVSQGLGGRHRAKGLRERSDQGELEPRACPVPFTCVCRVQGGVRADRWYPDVTEQKDSRQTNMMLNLWVTAGSADADPFGSADADPFVCFEAHQPSSESNAATGRPFAPAETTHSDTEKPAAWRRRQEYP